MATKCFRDAKGFRADPRGGAAAGKFPELDGIACCITVQE
jgi:hypothetical protein